MIMLWHWAVGIATGVVGLFAVVAVLLFLVWLFGTYEGNQHLNLLILIALICTLIGMATYGATKFGAYILQHWPHGL